MEVIIREHDELLEADGAVYSARALQALAYARASGAQVVAYAPQHETGARRFFLKQGIPLAQEPWPRLIEQNPTAAYLTTTVLKHSAPHSMRLRFSPSQLTQLGLTPLHVAHALDLLNIRRTT